MQILWADGRSLYYGAMINNHGAKALRISGRMKSIGTSRG
jgi:hypothetical protein